MQLDFVCAENVQHFDPACFEVIRDKRAMTTPTDCICAVMAVDCDLRVAQQSVAAATRAAVDLAAK
jgi:hypothetical protein